MYTRIPNWLIDKMPDLTHPAVKVALYIARKTIGWNRSSDVISLSQIQSGTGLSRPAIVKCISELESKQIIIVERIKQNQVSWNSYSIYEPVVNDVNQDSKSDLPDAVNDVNQVVVNDVNTQKKPIKKGKKDTIRDPRIDAWQLQIYRELARYHVPIAWRDEIISTVTDEVLWAHVIKSWIGRGYRPNAVGGMLEWYTKGVPDVKQQRGKVASRSGNNSGSLSPEEYIQQHQQ